MYKTLTRRNRIFGAILVLGILLLFGIPAACVWLAPMGSLTPAAPLSNQNAIAPVEMKVVPNGAPAAVPSSAPGTQSETPPVSPQAGPQNTAR